MSVTVPARLAKQCSTYGIPVETVAAVPVVGSKLWYDTGGVPRRVEEMCLSHYERRGYCGAWCEGGTLNLLMKAASFGVLVKHNFFGDRQDACRRFFEAQCTILSELHTDLLHAIATAQREEVESAATEILSEPVVRQYYPRVTVPFLLNLWEALGSDKLTDIARIFTSHPYDYRSGWPDLILIDAGQIRFVEVKTTDLLHESQLRIIAAFAVPLALEFSVAHVSPIREPST